MNLLNKLTLKNLSLNKKRTIVTIVGIILSIALISALSYMFYSFRGSLLNYEIKENGNFHVAYSNITSKDINIFTNNRKIEDVYFVSNLGYAKLDGIVNEYKPYLYVMAYDEKALSNLGVKLVSGRLPSNSSEIVIPKHLETNGGVTLNVGDYLTLDIGERVSFDGAILKQNNPYQKDDDNITEGLINTSPKKFKIVGIIERPSKNIEEYSAPGYSCLTFLGDNKLASDLSVYVRFNKKGLKNFVHESDNIIFKTEKESKAEYNDYLITIETGITKNPTLQALGSTCIVVIILIIISSVFCIKNSFDISITEKTRQYGMLASIGATNKQIKKNVYFEGFILGIIGIPIGIILGLIAAIILILISNVLLKNSLNIELIFTFSFVPIIISIILGFITIFLSARKSAKKASKISPIEAIRNNAEIKINSKKIKTPRIINNVFGIGGEISYKNLKRNKRKYRTTIISITICVSIFIALSYFTNIAYKSIKTELDTTDFDIELYFNKENEDILNKTDELFKLDGIKDYSYVLNSKVLTNNDTTHLTKEYLKYQDSDINGVNLIILSSESFKNYVQNLHLNYYDVKDKGILSNQIFIPDRNKYVAINKYTYKKDDVLNLSSKMHDEVSNYSFTIASVTDTLPIGFNQINFASYLFVDESYLKDFDNYNYYNTIYFKVNDAGKFQKDIDEVLKGYKYNIFNIVEEAKNFRSIVLLVSIFLYGFITVIALIGITNIFNTITTNINLRRREFAMLQSIGMTNKEFNRMISLESLFYGVKSLIIGIPIGIVLSYIMHKMIVEGEYSFRYELPLMTIILTCLVVIVLLITIMRYSIRKIKKQNIIETIRNENI